MNLHRMYQVMLDNFYNFILDIWRIYFIVARILQSKIYKLHQGYIVDNFRLDNLHSHKLLMFCLKLEVENKMCIILDLFDCM